MPGMVLDIVELGKIKVSQTLNYYFIWNYISGEMLGNFCLSYSGKIMF